MTSRAKENLSPHEPGSIPEVIHVAWPIVIGMLSYTAMGLADTLFVGWIGTTELAAVGLATTAIFLVNSFFLGSLHGVKVLAAQKTGAEEHGAAVTAAWQGAILAIPFGLLVIGLGTIDGTIFRAMGGSAEVQALAREYFGVRVFAAPFWYVTIALNDYFQGTGDTRTPMKANLLVNGLNIGLNGALIFGVGPFPELGVAGAAWATVIACVIGMLYVVRAFLVRTGTRARWDAAVGREVLTLGLPIGVRYVMGVAGWTVFTAILARMGEAELAAHQIAIRILSVSFLPGYGISEASTVMVGQYTGAGDKESARRSFRSSLWVACAIMGVMGFVFFLFPGAVLSVFRPEPRVVEIATQLLMIAALFQVGDAIAMTATGALNGIGDTRYTMLSSVAAGWLVQLPFAYLFGVHLGWAALGCWIGLTIEIFFLAVIQVRRWKSKMGAPVVEAAVEVVPAE